MSSGRRSSHRYRTAERTDPKPYRQRERLRGRNPDRGAAVGHEQLDRADIQHIKDNAPLKVYVYHDPNRSIANLADYDVVITSYGTRGSACEGGGNDSAGISVDLVRGSREVGESWTERRRGSIQSARG